MKLIWKKKDICRTVRLFSQVQIRKGSNNLGQPVEIGHRVCVAFNLSPQTEAQAETEATHCLGDGC